MGYGAASELCRQCRSAKGMRVWRHWWPECDQWVKQVFPSQMPRHIARHARTHARMHARTHERTHAYARVGGAMWIAKPAICRMSSRHACTHTHTHTCMHVCTHVCTHAHAHMCAHIHTHVRQSFFFGKPPLVDLWYSYSNCGGVDTYTASVALSGWIYFDL